MHKVTHELTDAEINQQCQLMENSQHYNTGIIISQDKTKQAWVLCRKLKHVVSTGGFLVIFVNCLVSASVNPCTLRVSTLWHVYSLMIILKYWHAVLHIVHGHRLQNVCDTIWVKLNMTHLVHPSLISQTTFYSYSDRKNPFDYKRKTWSGFHKTRSTLLFCHTQLQIASEVHALHAL